MRSFAIVFAALAASSASAASNVTVDYFFGSR